MGKNIERIISFDVMRIVAAFAVVFQHIGGQNWPPSFPSAEWELRNAYVSLAQWSVPIFILISGALFLNPEKQLTLERLYGKNILRIVYSFLFWSFVYVVCIEGFASGPIVAFISVLKGPPHFWFLKIMIGLYILVPVLKIIVADRKMLNYVMVVLLMTSFVIPSAFDHFGLFDEQRMLIWRGLYDEFGLPSLGFVFYFILGHYLYTTSFSRRVRIAIYIVGVLSFACGAFSTSAYSHYIGRTEGFFYDDLHPFMLLQTSAIFLFIKDHCTDCSSKTRRLVVNLSNCSFGIYLVHPLFMHLCNEHLALNSSSFNPVFFIPVFAVFIFFLSFVLVKIVSMIPYLKKVVL